MLSGPAGGAMHALARLPQQALLLLVRFYRFWLQPWLGNVCRYEPSCSAYALQSLQHHGAGKGVVLAAWRVLRCNPWSLGGNDPVPASWSWRLPRCCAAVKAEDSKPHGRGLFTRLVQTEAAPAPADAAASNRNQP